MIGILAFGSLLSDCGIEIKCATEGLIDVVTPFKVEFARLSGKTRGGAPTLVPVSIGGERVNAKIFCLKSTVTLEEARDILYRREKGAVGTSEKYVQPTDKKPNSVVVREIANFSNCEYVIYTDFNDCGKEKNITPEALAKAAIKSVRPDNEGKDGITYLIDVKANGIHTPLMEEYEQEIMSRTVTTSLCEAIRKLKQI